MSQKSQNFRKRPMDKFVDLAAAQRYSMHFRKNKVSMERSFSINRVEMLSHKKIMERRSWTNFFLFSIPACVEIVREFYANLPCAENDKVFVRGIWVPFGRKDINKIYELPDVNDGVFQEKIQEERIRTMGERLCAYEATWKETRGVPKLLKIESLDPIFKIWILLLFSKALPTSSKNWINKERIQLLYGFREGWVMNLGRVIYTTLLDCTMEMPKGKLPFPQLITALCVAAGVDFNAIEEEMIDPPAPIDCRTVRGIWEEFEMMEERRREKKEP